MDAESKTMLRVWVFLFFLVVVQCQENSSTVSVSFAGEGRGGYGGGGGGYGGGSGGGYGGYGGGSGHISMDPVSILGLLSLGAVLLRSILTLLRASARSLDVTDMNLPLMLSDIPEAIANWQGGSHVVYERSVDDAESENDDDNPMSPINNYLSMLKTDRRCISHFLCQFWKRRMMDGETFLDAVMLVTAQWNGLSDSAAIYDQIKKPGSVTAEFHCTQARADCPGE